MKPGVTYVDGRRAGGRSREGLAQDTYMYQFPGFPRSNDTRCNNTPSSPLLYFRPEPPKSPNISSKQLYEYNAKWDQFSRFSRSRRRTWCILPLANRPGASPTSTLAAKSLPCRCPPASLPDKHCRTNTAGPPTSTTPGCDPGPPTSTSAADAAAHARAVGYRECQHSLGHQHRRGRACARALARDARPVGRGRRRVDHGLL